MEDIELEVRTMPTDDLSGTVVFTTKLVATNSGESTLLKCLRFRSQIATNKDKRYLLWISYVNLTSIASLLVR